MARRADRPYDDLPPLPPRCELETRAVLKATIAARAALAALDQATRRLPNPDVLLNAASLLEAQASSEIENIVTTADELFRYAPEESGGGHATKEALRYRTALLEGVESLRSRPLTFGTCEVVCSRIKGVEMSIRRVPGTRIANPSSGQVVYAPPEGEATIRALLGNWEEFVHAENDLDPLVRMAVAHYQFEAIHPFHDGNGRTGRIANILMLVESGLLSRPVLYLSRYILRHKNDYYRLLREVTEHDRWEPWICYLLAGIEETASTTLTKIGSIESWQSTVQERLRDVTKGGRNVDFLAVLFEQPYCRIATVVDRCQVSRPTASSWLESTAEAGLLDVHRTGRDKFFVNRRFLDILQQEEPTTSLPSTDALF